MAASTKETESAQALFCALADFVSNKKIEDILNLEKYPSFWHFTGYTENKAKGYNKALATALKEAKKNVPTLDKDEFEVGFKKDSLKKYKTLWKTHNKYLDEAMKHTVVNVPGGLDKMKKVLDDELGWYESSVKIAVKLLKDLTKIDPDYNITGAGCQMVYYRGEKENPIMGLVGELFKTANESVKKSQTTGKNKKIKVLGDINKWSPADMYFATKTAKTALENLKSDPGLDFETLNDTISKQIDAGQLLPLSLKKVKDNVHLVKVNFDTTAKQGILDSVIYEGTTQPGFNKMAAKEEGRVLIYGITPNFGWKMPRNSEGPVYTRSEKVDGKNIAYRDIYLNFTVTERYIGETRASPHNVSFQFRHTPAASGKPSAGIKVILHYENLNAISAGQVVGIDGLCDLIRVHDPTFATKLKKSYNDSIRDFKTVANAYINAPTPGKYFKGGAMHKHGMGQSLYLGQYPDFMTDYLAQYRQQVNPSAREVSWGTFNSAKDIILTKAQQKTIFNEDMGAISGRTVMNRFRTTLDNYFKGPDTGGIKRNIIMEIYKYTSSRSPESAKFVIAK